MTPESQGRTGRPPKGAMTMNEEVKIRLEPMLAQRLKAASVKTHLPMAELIREAIREYLNRIEKFIGNDYY